MPKGSEEEEGGEEGGFDLVEEGTELKSIEERRILSPSGTAGLEVGWG